MLGNCPYEAVAASPANVRFLQGAGLGGLFDERLHRTRQPDLWDWLRNHPHTDAIGAFEDGIVSLGSYHGVQ